MILKNKKAVSWLLTLAMVFSLFSGIWPTTAVRAEDYQVVLVGNLQDELGHSSEWDPSAEKTKMTSLGNGFYSFKGILPGGDYEYKIAIGGSWSENYGKDGQSGGDNIKLSLAEETEVIFYYNHNTHKIADSSWYNAIETSRLPRLVGSLQEAIGDESNWSPEKAGGLMYDDDFDGIYSVTVEISQGDYEYKVTLGSSWDENYGLNGERDGGNIPLNVKEDTEITFFYNSNTHEISNDYNPNGADDSVDKSALYHDSRNILYRIPFGAVPVGTEVILRLRTKHEDLTRAKLYTVNNATGNSKYYTMESVGFTEDKEYDIWEARFIPETKGVYGYKFVAGDGSASVEYGDDNGLNGTGTSFDSGAKEFQLTVYDPDYKTPDWMKTATVYQIFPDRFFNGNSDNDDIKEYARGYEEIESREWNEIPDNPRKKEQSGYDGDGIWSNDFFGGDIEGIRQKLDYLQEIGINTIYLNPIAKAASNHKYDATDYKEVDPMFGTLEEFQTFTNELEDRNMHLIIDGVFNHVGDDSVYFDRYGKYSTVGAYEYWSRIYDEMNENEELTEEQAKTKVEEELIAEGQIFSEEGWHNWFNIKNEKVTPSSNETSPDQTTKEYYNYQSWWGYDSLPEFKSLEPEETIGWDKAKVDYGSELNNKELANFIMYDDDSVAKTWLQRGAAGWRLDVANEVDTEFWREFRKEIKASDFISKIGTEPVILGEIWDDASKYFLGDQYDSVMNYRFRGAVLNFLKSGNAEKYMEELEAIREDYPQEAFYALMNLVDSHDTERALFILGEDAATETANTASQLAVERLKLASIFQMGYPGAPTIYYGDEAGLTGAADPDCRRTYPWGNENMDLLEHYKKVGKIRENNKVLQLGDVKSAYAEDDIMAFARKLEDDAAIVIINRGDTEKTIAADVEDYLRDEVIFVDMLSGESTEYVSNGGLVNITVPAMAGRILIANEGQDLTPYEEIASLEVTDVGDATVSIKWDAVKDAKYNVYRTTFKGGNYELLTGEPVDGTTYTDKTVKNATIYYYAVTTVDDEGNESEKKETNQIIPHKDIYSGWVGNLDANDLIPDETVIGSVYELDDVTAEIWIDGITDKSGAGEGISARLGVKHEDDNDWSWYEAEYKGDSGNNDIYGISFIPMVTGIFTYQMEFSTDLGTSWRSAGSKEVLVKPSSDQIPPPPADLQQPEQESGRVTLNWTVQDAVYNTVQEVVYNTFVKDVYGFEIYRDGEILDIIWDPEVRSYTDYSVENGAAYEYMVDSFDDSFNREKGNAVTVTPDQVMVEVTFKLHAPGYTSLEESITIPGSFSDTQWNVNSHEMTRGGAVTPDYTYTMEIEPGREIYYKYVRNNTWDNEGLAVHGGQGLEDISYYGYGAAGTDLHIIVENQGGNKMIVEDEILRWIDMPVVFYNNPDGTTVDTEEITLKGSVIKDPVLAINGDEVTDIEYNENNKQYEFSHKVKLDYGKNVINVHVEPKEANKSNIFKSDGGAIGKATKDYTITVTTTGGTPSSNSDGGSSRNNPKKYKDDDDVNKIIDDLDDNLKPDEASDVLKQIGDKDVSPEMAKEALTKVIESVDDIDNEITEAIVEVINKIGEIDEIEIQTEDGKKVVKVDDKDLESALTRIEQEIYDIAEMLEEKGNIKAAEKLKKDSAVTVAVGDMADDEGLEVPISTNFMKKLQKKGIGIQILSDKEAIKLPADAIDSEIINSAEEVKIIKEYVESTDAEKIKEKLVAVDNDLTPIGKIYNFEVSVVDKEGNNKKVDRFNSKAKVEVQMDSDDLTSIKDKRKAGVYYVAEDGTTEFKGGKFSNTGVEFETDHFSSYVVMEYNKTFQDVKENWAEDYIEVLAARRITEGVDENNFNPTGKVTRAQFATFLGRSLGIEESAYDDIFSDISKDAYYTGYVLALKEAKLINGYEDGTFKPDAEITREQMITMVMRVYEYISGENVTSVDGYNSADFADIGEVSDYAVNSLKAAKALGLANGVGDNAFNPTGTADRAAVAKIIVELLEEIDEI